MIKKPSVGCDSTVVEEVFIEMTLLSTL